MRLTLIALAALAVAGVTPAAACGPALCPGEALADDSYPPGEPTLTPTVQAIVFARQGKGMSLAGFYNDPSLALAQRDYAPRPYGYIPAPEPAYVEAPAAEPAYVEPAAPSVGYDFARHRHPGPRVIMSPYGHERRMARESHEGHNVY